MTLSMQPAVSGWEPGLSRFNTHCSYCALQCALKMKVDTVKNQVVKVWGRRDFPTNRGLSCIKGQTAHQQINHADRLTQPLLRESKEGPFREVSWDKALDFTTQRLQEIQQAHGADSAAVFGGGALTNEAVYLLGKFARVALKTRNIDYNGRYCMSSAAAAQNASFGVDRGLNFPLSDIFESRCILLVGANVAECLPPIQVFLKRAKKHGAKIIVADPRSSKTAEIADLKLMPKPGTDSALAIALLSEVIAEGGVDEQYLNQRVQGFEAVLAFARGFDAQWGEKVTGVPDLVIRQAARWLIRSKPSLILTGRGAEQHSKGVETVQAFINLALALGQVGKIGGGFGTLTGQGNGQGGREHGQKADQLPGYRSIESQKDRAVVTQAWGVEEKDLPQKGLSAQEILQAADSGDIKAMWVVGSNPAVSAPNGRRMKNALTNLSFLAVSDFFFSETCQAANVVFPATLFAEEDGTMTNIEGRCVLRRSGVKPPGEARPDWKVITDLAGRLGAGKHFSYSNTEAVFNELARVTAGSRADYSGMTYSKLERNRGLFWPCPDVNHAGTLRLFEYSFFHPDGKARMKLVEYRESAEMPDTTYPYRLTTGRVLEHYLSGNQTRRIEPLKAAVPEPFVEVSEKLSQRLGLRPGHKVKLATRRGEVSLPWKANAEQEESTLFVPFHWGGEDSVNLLTQAALDPVSRMPELKVCAANLTQDKTNDDFTTEDSGSSEKFL
ncbi:MAG TPA: molybdopterin oxidoreductase family protein [bacterium]|nr:molybdopterin oxidoreductase family protein [bacterium]